MKVHEFFAKYANTPIGQRFIPLKGIVTLYHLYAQISMLEDAMRPMRINEEELLEIAEKGFKDLKKMKGKGR